MKMTIKQLAEKSGVSTRTLRYYDEIGLLMPAYLAENGYRYYGEKELLLLQQILFYRALDFTLDDIKSIILDESFNQLKALQSHRQALLDRHHHLQQLISTIDKTILHLKGDIIMKDAELFIGFKHPKQLEMAAYLEENMGERAQTIIASTKAKLSQFTKEDLAAIKHENDQWKQDMKSLLKQSKGPESDEVQAMIEQYYNKNIVPYYEASGADIIEMTELSIAHKSTKAIFSDVHADFAEFFLAAIKYYVKANNL